MDVQVQSRVVQAAQHLPFEVVALVLQGGGALGAYQAGVYEALSEAGIHELDCRHVDRRHQRRHHRRRCAR